MANYDFFAIEKKWQKYWKENKINQVDNNYSKPKYYVLDMFPYPSGAGLHIGHPEGYTATDIISRFKKMQGYNVLHPMGFDAFGLPTERYSMTTGIHPNIATQINISTYIKQLDAIGLGYDWNRMINTTDPNYYKWTQFMFTLIYNSWFDKEQNKARPIEQLPVPTGLTPIEIEKYKDQHRLAYIANIPVNWCAELGTVLANEEVDEWRSKGYSVERKPMRQWMLRITEYAQRLIEDLELVEWAPSTKEMQKHWIGKSVGAEVIFPILGHKENIIVFTTRPDTIFGATYIVLAPEHSLVKSITTDIQKKSVEEYINTASQKSDLERTELNKDKTGVFTGAYATNPATEEKIPIWIADYVLAHYGTGAIMSVPAHDKRDHSFAKKNNLPIIQVVTDKNNTIDINKDAFCEPGYSINSTNNFIDLNNLSTPEAIEKICVWMLQAGIGKATTQYKLRDWLFSRQRYWGEPIPIILFDDGTKRCLDFEELPLILPEIKDFKPAGTGESPLANVPEWVSFIDKKTGKKGGYETNTMPQWAGSCWYYLRYIDPHNTNCFCDPEAEKYWMSNGGVDLYIGGAEHAVLHLLYARFWHKVLYDYNYVSTPEPFKKLFHQGLIMGEDGRKMSKSLGNVINPDAVIEAFGADSLRLFEMFLGPLEVSKPWSTTGLEGINRFLNRVWRMISDDDSNLLPTVKDVAMTEEQEYQLNYTIKKISEDIEVLSFNTAISQMMIFVNEFTKAEIRSKEAMNKFILCLYPFAPHICEELWRILGNINSVTLEKYPEYDATKIVRNKIELVVQVNSKIRGKITVPAGSSQEEVQEISNKDPNVQKYISEGTTRKIIFVKDKIINFIVN